MTVETFEFIYKGEKISLHMNLEEPNDPRTQMILLTRPDSRILEFGCNTGFCSKVLSDRGCEVTGVELDSEAARIAKKFCKKVIVADVENPKFLKKIGREKFDHIMLGSFIEHLSNPADLLCRIKPLLKADGTVILNVPNIAHWSVRMELLQGNFDYQPTGILDNTHLFHFTKKSMTEMLNDCGYEVGLVSSFVVPIDEDKIKADLEDIGLDCHRELVTFLIRLTRMLTSTLPRPVSNQSNKRNQWLKKTRSYRLRA